MELIPYSEFAKLRLSVFISPDIALTTSTNWEWLGKQWINEGIGFTSFSCPQNTPDETWGMELDLKDLAPSSQQNLLDAVGLPLKRGMSFPDICSILGSPTKTQQFVPRRSTYNFVVGISCHYTVSCTVEDEAGLAYISIVRLDI